MKRWVILGLMLGLMSLAEGKEDPTNVLLSTSKTDRPAEGILIFLLDDGKFETDSGTEFKDLRELTAFFVNKGAVFSPRLVVSVAAAKNHGALMVDALFLFEQYCKAYSLFIEQGSD